MCIYIYILFFNFVCTFRLPMVIGIDESWMERVTSPFVDAVKIALTDSKAQVRYIRPEKSLNEGDAI